MNIFSKKNPNLILKKDLFLFFFFFWGGGGGGGARMIEKGFY